jgi:hypothetical protein
MAAVSQIRYRGTEGRVYCESKNGEGMTGRCALRALKRKISDALYVRMISDARLRTSGGARAREGNRGTTLTRARLAPTPEHQRFGQATPGPTPTPELQPHRACPHLGLLLLGAQPAAAQPGVQTFHALKLSSRSPPPSSRAGTLEGKAWLTGNGGSGRPGVGHGTHASAPAMSSTG